jgi:hypothetical protein
MHTTGKVFYLKVLVSPKQSITWFQQAAQKVGCYSNSFGLEHSGLHWE